MKIVMCGEATKRVYLPIIFRENREAGLQSIREHTYPQHLTCYESGVPYRNHPKNGTKFVKFTEHETTEPGVKYEEASRGAIFVNVRNGNTVINTVN
jgi:hypothetical protein